jgi:hypothetical protein
VAGEIGVRGALAPQTVQYEETIDQRKARKLADLPSQGYAFTDAKGIHN